MPSRRRLADYLNFVPERHRSSVPIARDVQLSIEHRLARLAQVLDLLAEDNRLNVYAGQVEVRPPGAPTTG